MRVCDIFEAINAPDLLLYHFCGGDALRAILGQNRLEAETTHTIGGVRYRGASLTRDRSLQLLKTYAVTGGRAFRIGFNANRLRLAGHRIIPVRDEYLRRLHKARRSPNGVLTALNLGFEVMADSNEAEEFLMPKGGLPYLDHATYFMDEIAVDNRIMLRMTEDEDENENLATYRAIYTATMNSDLYDGEVMYPITLPPHIRFAETHEEYFHPENDYAARPGVGSPPKPLRPAPK